MTLNQKLYRICHLLKVIQKLEKQFATAVKDFFNVNAYQDRMLFSHDHAKQHGLLDDVTSILLEASVKNLIAEIEQPIPDKWDETVAELASLGIVQNFHNIGTARYLHVSLMSYMTYLYLKNRCDREEKPFPQRWSELFSNFATEFTAITGD
jgi:hypothetical protein